MSRHGNKKQWSLRFVLVRLFFLFYVIVVFVGCFGFSFFVFSLLAVFVLFLSIFVCFPSFGILATNVVDFLFSLFFGVQPV